MDTRDITDFINERFKNPFLASLSFFWIIFNWKVLGYVFFSSDSIEDKFINYVLYINEFNLYLFPLIAAFLYSVGSSFAFAGIDFLASKGFHLRKKIYYDKAEIDIKSQERIELAKAHLEEAKTKFKAREELNNKIKSMEALVESKEIKIKELEVLNNDSMKIFNALRDSVNKFFKYDLLQKSIADFVNTTSIDDMKHYGLSIYGAIESYRNDIHFDEEENRKELYGLIHKGFVNLSFEKNKISHIELTPLGNYLLKIFLLTNNETLENLVFDFKNY